MNKYIKTFDTDADYQSFISGEFDKPNLSYVESTGDVYYNDVDPGPTDIFFDSDQYTMYGGEGETLTESFTVSDDLGNDVTSLCSYTFSPNDKGVYADGGYFTVDSAEEGQYNVSVTATYGELTTTATISLQVAAVAHLIQFDSDQYTLSGTEGDTIQQQFAVTDDNGNDISMDCAYSFTPNDTDLVVSDVGGEYYAFDASSVSAGQYTVAVEATYNGMLATTEVVMDIAAAE